MFKILKIDLLKITVFIIKNISLLQTKNSQYFYKSIEK